MPACTACATPLPPGASSHQAFALAEAALTLRAAAIWRELDILEACVACLGAPALAGFHSLLLPIRQSAMVAAASAHAASIRATAPTLPRLSPNRSLLRVAVLRGSANANEERIAALLSLSPRAFEAALLTTQLDPHAAMRIRALAPARLEHVALAGVADDDAARSLAARGCAILVDGSGHTAGHRLGVVARRPCAVRTAALGFAGSYGGGLVDYLTADRAVVPPAAAAAIPERLSVLPHSYQVAPLPLERAAAAAAVAAERHHRPQLGSFARVLRLHPSNFALWCAVLRRTPAAELRLLVDDAPTRARLRDELAAAGIARRRLHFWRYEPDKAAHIARHRLLSLLLDTTPTFGAHTTAADAALHAVPMLTLPADAWASRVGASLGAAVGVPQLAAHSARALVAAQGALLDARGSSRALTRALRAAAWRQRALGRRSEELWRASRRTMGRIEPPPPP